MVSELKIYMTSISRDNGFDRSEDMPLCERKNHRQRLLEALRQDSTQRSVLRDLSKRPKRCHFLPSRPRHGTTSFLARIRISTYACTDRLEIFPNPSHNRCRRHRAIQKTSTI